MIFEKMSAAVRKIAEIGQKRDDEIWMGMTRIISRQKRDRTWIEVSNEDLKREMQAYEDACPEEVRATLNFKIIPMTIHDNWYEGAYEATASFGLNAYRSLTAAEIDQMANGEKARVRARIDEQMALERATYERLKARFENMYAVNTDHAGARQ